MTQGQTISDVEFMRNDKRWPYWPILPLKRPDKNGLPECGFITAHRGRPTTIIIANMYDDLGAKTIGELYEKYKLIEYDSFEAIVEDGWVVD